MRIIDLRALNDDHFDFVMGNNAIHDLNDSVLKFN